MKRSIDRASAQAEPHQVWNAFVDLLAMEDPADLTPEQRVAQLVFWYDSEVQNGGHGQFFDNRGLEQLGGTVEALKTLGLKAHAQLLSRALDKVKRSGGDQPWEEILGEEFVEELDEAFEACKPTVTEALQRHLGSHRAAYVELV